MANAAENVTFWDRRIEDMPPERLRFLQRKISEPIVSPRPIVRPEDLTIQECLEAIKDGFRIIFRALWLICFKLYFRASLYLRAQSVSSRGARLLSNLTSSIVGAAAMSVAILAYLQLLAG